MSDIPDQREAQNREIIREQAAEIVRLREERDNAEREYSLLLTRHTQQGLALGAAERAATTAESALAAKDAEIAGLRDRFVTEASQGLSRLPAYYRLIANIGATQVIVYDDALAVIAALKETANG